MKNKIHFVVIRLLMIALMMRISFAQAQILPKPNAQQLAWQKAELGVLFHYDLHVFDPSKYAQSANRITPVADYNIFNPGSLDVEQWVRSAKDAGAKFAIITATHETGFALFQSNVNPYSLKALKWKDGKADIVKDFVEACRKYGLKPGIYLGIRWNSFLGVHDFIVDGTGEMQKKRQQYYNAMVEGMVKEICTNYGDLFEIWFDGGASGPEKGAPDVLPIVKKYQPNCLFYHNDQLAEARWGGSESGKVSYPCWSTFTYPSTGSGESTYKGISANNFELLKHGDVNGKYWMPAMADAPLRGYNGRHEWFWEPNDEQHIFPLDDLLDIYYKSVGRNSTLILGLTPDNRGLLPEADVKRLKEFGAEIKSRFENPIAVTSGSKKVLQLNLSKATTIKQFVIQEEIADGQRIRSFSIEYFSNGKWEKAFNGFSVGNKFIHLLEKPITATKVRLVINVAVGAFQITEFGIY
ncbi:alpha-L-fucosidase [Pedobacter sp. N36a]|uniref:alpha-L-fucosidase n=1 Tax=Pedobacter sp. N36a TaxID=2767996 RepID=UPI001657262C|nr:alpha-L-fucosidase [Pedobacter sp. N36a]MBC8988007.1 alpha-L-fucosidase [Pedobacter sp. N36a]